MRIQSGELQQEGIIDSSMQYSKQLLSMKHSPFLDQDNIQYQREQVTSYGCCFSPLYTENREYKNPKPERFRFHSEPREPKLKKIDLVTPKRGLSASKQIYLSTQRTVKQSTNPLKTEPHSKEKQHQKLSLTSSSKIASIRTSRETSKVSFNKDLRIDYPPGEVKQSWMTTKNTTKPLHTEVSHPVNDNQTSLAFISEISFVEEEFISQGSETLQALNFIAQIKSAEPKNYSQKTSFNPCSIQKIDKANSRRQLDSPFSRKVEDCRIKASGRKKLIL